MSTTMRRYKKTHKKLFEPFFDVRSASESYSNIAAVIAGFAFTAIVLVIQIPDLQPDAFLSRDFATVAFIVAFIGCLLSALTFSIVKGDEVLSKRTFSMAFFGGCSFLISANLVLFGLAIISKVYLSSSIYFFISYSFPFLMAFTIFYIGFNVFDPIICFERREIGVLEYLETFGLSLLLLVPVIVYKLIINGKFVSSISLFNLFLYLALILIIINAMFVLIIGNRKKLYNKSLYIYGIWICLHSIVISFLIIMI